MENFEVSGVLDPRLRGDDKEGVVRQGAWRQAWLPRSALSSRFGEARTGIQYSVEPVRDIREFSGFLDPRLRGDDKEGVVGQGLRGKRGQLVPRCHPGLAKPGPGIQYSVEPVRDIREFRGVLDPRLSGDDKEGVVGPGPRGKRCSLTPRCHPGLVKPRPGSSTLGSW